MIFELHCKSFFRTQGFAYLPVGRTLPPGVVGQKNGDGQLDLNCRVGVKPKRHALPAEVAQDDKRIASEANQDEEPGRSLQGHADADRRLVSAVGREQQGEEGEGQQHQRCEQTDVQHGVDEYRRAKGEGHLRVEKLQTRHDDRGQDLGDDQ